LFDIRYWIRRLAFCSLALLRSEAEGGKQRTPFRTTGAGRAFGCGATRTEESRSGNWKVPGNRKLRLPEQGKGGVSKFQTKMPGGTPSRGISDLKWLFFFYFGEKNSGKGLSTREETLVKCSQNLARVDTIVYKN
jgi:hypothetical protein